MTSEEQKAAQDKVNARIEELKGFAGKSFARKGDAKKTVIKILGYDGVKVKDGVSTYTFLVESKDARWTPPATQFLEEHEEIQVPETATKSNEII